MSNATEATEAPKFETLMDELETIVARLERGELSLEDSLTAFERGVGASQAAGKLLDAAEARVDVLVRAESTETIPFHED
ncbi:MAG: exodeoxyribonuclease VII small subunit [Myxococcales bacterium]|nr:exodeoxyribonuclease VII small subunit [Myxococcales bacterium]